jgi:hypothetical protein
LIKIRKAMNSEIRNANKSEIIAGKYLFKNMDAKTKQTTAMIKNIDTLKILNNLLTTY